MVQRYNLLLPVPSSSSIGIVESSVSMRYEMRELIVSKASIENFGECAVAGTSG